MQILTKRIPTLVGLLLIVAGVFGGYKYLQGGKIDQSKEITPNKVRITNIADNKFSVSWVSDLATIGYVEYGEIGGKLTNKAYDDRDDETDQGEYKTHHVTVEGLQPSKQYAFRIVAGDKPVRFDNGGSPYTTGTGPVIGAIPTSQNFYGNVTDPSKQAAEGAIVYLTLPGGATASTLVSESGNYAFTLSTLRASDLRSFVKHDPSASIVSVTVESGNLQSIVSVALANSTPVPPITVGQNAEFLAVGQKPEIAQVSQEEEVEEPSILNVEPLNPEVNVVTSDIVTILNPKDPGETLATLRPEFRGTGGKGVTLSIALTGQKAISDTVTVASDGTWSWAPVIDLKAGKQKISVSYLDGNGSSKKVEREFNISTVKAGIDPAFVSSPSGLTSTNSAGIASGSPSATPRVAMPDTTEGTPVSGVIENTLLTAGLGIVIMVVGAVLLAL